MRLQGRQGGMRDSQNRPAELVGGRAVPHQMVPLAPSPMRTATDSSIFCTTSALMQLACGSGREGKGGR